MQRVLLFIILFAIKNKMPVPKNGSGVYRVTPATKNLHKYEVSGINLGLSELHALPFALQAEQSGHY